MKRILSEPPPKPKFFYEGSDMEILVGDVIIAHTAEGNTRHPSFVTAVTAFDPTDGKYPISISPNPFFDDVEYNVVGPEECEFLARPASAEERKLLIELQP